MKTLFLIAGILILLLGIGLFVTRAKPLITLDFNSFEQGRKVVLEAENADGTQMSFKEARRIMKENERHTIILSEDNGKIDEDESFDRYKRRGFFE